MRLKGFVIIKNRIIEVPINTIMQACRIGNS